MLDCQEDRVEDGVEKLQQALEAQQGKLINAVYEAIGIVGRTLATAGESLAAQAHLFMQVAAVARPGPQRDDGPAGARSERADSAGRARHDCRSSPPDANTPLAAADVAEFNAALQQADLGCWAGRRSKFEALAKKTPERAGSVEEHRRAAGPAARQRRRDRRPRSAMPRWPRSRATRPSKPMALANYLSEPTDVDFVDEVTAIYAVTDPAGPPGAPAVEQAGAEPAVRSGHVPRGERAAADGRVPGARPRGSADRRNLSRDNVPKVLGEVLLYRQGDRPAARVEFVSVKSADFEARLKALQDAIGTFLGAKAGRGDQRQDGRGRRRPGDQLAIPRRHAADVRKRMIQEHRTQIAAQHLAEPADGRLDGKSPRQSPSPIRPGKSACRRSSCTMDLAEPDRKPRLQQAPPLARPCRRSNRSIRPACASIALARPANAAGRGQADR